MIEKSLTELNFKNLLQRKFYPSPAAWEDQVLYFLMLDRFSDGNERGYKDNNGAWAEAGNTPGFQPADRGNATQTTDQRQHWFEAGGRFVGGTLKGLASKMGYLKRLGVTAIWVSPVFKQVAFQESYHGYGIQNFLDVDPHFGTRAELQEMVQTAHAHGIYVILDVILNHAGDVFQYDADRYDCQGPGSARICDPRWDGNLYRVKGFNDKNGQPRLPFAPVDLQRYPDAWPDGAIWPVELQHPSVFTCKGRISDWDNYPEYLEGDFCSLKDICLGHGALDDYEPSPALRSLCEIYKFWIAYTDVDGFRVDTVKHMDPGATRYFANIIHEFTQRLGKENFYLIGEITGGRQRAFETLELTGLNAALGIDDIPDKMEYLVKGFRNPSEYFQLFRNSLLVLKDSHVWFRNKVVTTFDDHDQVRKGNNKARFCADPGAERLVLNVLALNVTTLGIPCIYYGTEQAFDGHGNNDRYIRESMFGGEFGAFETRHRHFFNEDHPVYQQLAQINRIRAQYIALRRGRQYLRPISTDGGHFCKPQMINNEIRSIVPWSRLFDHQEILLALNTDARQSQTAWVTIDDGLHPAGSTLTCLYSTDKNQLHQTVQVEARNGKSVWLTVPPAGFVIYV